MASLMTLDPDVGRQLPTRVSNACERCRRNKSRVSFNPFSSTTRGNQLKSQQV